MSFQAREDGQTGRAKLRLAHWPSWCLSEWLTETMETAKTLRDHHYHFAYCGTNWDS